MTDFAISKIMGARSKFRYIGSNLLCVKNSLLYRIKFVELLRNACNNTSKNASAPYMPADAVQCGTYIKNPKPSKECTYSVIKSDRKRIYRQLNILVLVR